MFVLNEIKTGRGTLALQRKTIGHNELRKTCLRKREAFVWIEHELYPTTTFKDFELASIPYWLTDRIIVPIQAFALALILKICDYILNRFYKTFVWMYCHIIPQMSFWQMFGSSQFRGSTVGWGVFRRILYGKNLKILLITSCTPTKFTWSILCPSTSPWFRENNGYCPTTLWQCPWTLWQCPWTLWQCPGTRTFRHPKKFAKKPRIREATLEQLSVN